MGVDSPHSNAGAPRRVGQEIADRTTILDAIKTIEEFVRVENWPERLQSAWRIVRGEVVGGRAKGGCPEQGELKDLQRQINSIEKAVQSLVKGQPSASKLSYAAALQKGPLFSEQRKEMPVPARRSREVVIAAGSETPAQKQRSGAELIRDVNTALSYEAVVAARRLQSGDVLLTFSSDIEKKKWEKDPKLMVAFGANGKLRTREYTILAHRIRVALINVKN